MALDAAYLLFPCEEELPKKGKELDGQKNEAQALLARTETTMPPTLADRGSASK